MHSHYRQSRDRRVSRENQRTRPHTPSFRFLIVLVSGLVLVLVALCSTPGLLFSPPPQAPMALPVAPATLVQQPTITPIPGSLPAEAEPAAPPIPAEVSAAVGAAEGQASNASQRTGNGAALPMPTNAPKSIPNVAGQAGKLIDKHMIDLTNAQLFSGVLLVVDHGQVIVHKGYGLADSEQGSANTPQTRFRLASLTKAFTAMAILILQHQDKLNVQDPICTYLPDCPAEWQAITIRHLLTHTSGIPNYTDFIEFETTEMLTTTTTELLSRFRDLPLAFAPGEMYSYDNSGYVLLGLIIERVSGQSYADFLQSAIFTPLGMTSTGYDQNVGAIQPGQAMGYTSIGVKAPFIDTSTLFAAGGLYSTAEDMLRWHQALKSEQLIPQALMQEMFTPLHMGYGYGWKMQRVADHLAATHSGYFNGFSNYIVHFKDDDLFILVLSNLQSAASYDISAYAARLVFENR
ncbi:MAG: beta-lactamase family protein [Chloroflexaceae bacterium]|nr:beta-lactamase family protein [Chloroflexaceae bacterium]